MFLIKNQRGVNFSKIGRVNPYPDTIIIKVNTAKIQEKILLSFNKREAKK